MLFLSICGLSGSVNANRLIEVFAEGRKDRFGASWVAEGEGESMLRASSVEDLVKAVRPRRMPGTLDIPGAKGPCGPGRKAPE